jgi:hypothetical protein
MAALRGRGFAASRAVLKVQWLAAMCLGGLFCVLSDGSDGSDGSVGSDRSHRSHHLAGSAPQPPPAVAATLN